MRIICTFLFSMLISFQASAEAVTSAGAAVLRGLDKIDGSLTDITLAKGQSATYGRLEIRLTDCRYPTGNPSGNAYAYLDIKDLGVDKAVFSGWMIASAPALNALDHPRYDVWVMRCITE